MDFSRELEILNFSVMILIFCLPFVFLREIDKLKSKLVKMIKISDDEDKQVSVDFNNIPNVNPGMFVSGW